MLDTDVTKEQLLAELKELREKTRQQQKLLLTSTDFFHRCSRSLFEPYRIDWIEGSAEAVLGYTREQLTRAGCWLGFVHPEDIEAVGRLLMSLKPGDVGEQEFRFINKDGRVRWINERYRCESDASGTHSILYGATKDVTATKLAEAALRESEKRFRIVADNTTFWEYWQAPGGEFHWVSPACERVSGYAAAEFMGSPRLRITDIIHPDDAKIWADHIDEADRRTLAHCELEFRLIKKSGETIWIAHSCNSNYDENGVYLGRRGCNLDITDRKRAEALMRAMLVNLPLDFWARDQSGAIIIQSDISRAIWGDLRRPAKEAALPPETVARWQANQARVRGGETVNGEAEHVLPDGSQVFFHEILAPIRDRDAVLGIMGVNVDLTERRRMENELRAAKETAEAASRTKSAFLANMSHEIRTPLNGILGMLQLLGTTVLDAEQQYCLRAAVTSSDRLTQLLSDILDLSRIEAGKFRPQIAPFSLSGLRQSVLDLFDLAAREQGLRLEFTVDDAAAPWLMGDETRLRQILFNLVGNAVKFTPQGQVRIEAFALPSRIPDKLRVLFRISDTGIGIPDALLETIFEPFTQAEGTYTRRFQGAGLGLSIVRKLVNLLGGELCIDSTEGVGTTMYCSLPFTVPEGVPREAAHPLAQPSEDTCEPGWRILFAEDEAVSLMAGKRLLEKSGHCVVTAASGQEVLEHLARQEFDLVLMDVQMPVLDGVAATRAIRQGTAGRAKAEIPIIAMTAYAMSGDREKFLEAGMNDWVAKPVDLADLLAAIDRVMAAKETARPAGEEGMPPAAGRG